MVTLQSSPAAAPGTLVESASIHTGVPERLRFGARYGQGRSARVERPKARSNFDPLPRTESPDNAGVLKIKM